MHMDRISATNADMKAKYFFRVLGVAILITAICLIAVIKYATKEPSFGGDFSLTYRGQPWHFSEKPKELNLLYFGYAKCPDVCPLTLSYAGSAFRKLSLTDLSQVRLIFVSVDQEHDNPDDVADYATNFFPEFLGMSGSQQQIDDTIHLFPASYMVEKNPKSYLGYSISHTDRIFFLDKNGKVIDSVAGPRDTESILTKLKEHL